MHFCPEGMASQYSVSVSQYSITVLSVVQRAKAAKLITMQLLHYFFFFCSKISISPVYASLSVSWIDQKEWKEKGLTHKGL